MALVARGLASTRSRAQALILAGDVLVDGRLAQKAGELVKDASAISIVAGPRFASRGGEKLDWALERFEIDLTGAVCADIGASTGGFTDAMLQRGAARVFAIDVGYGQIALRLRNDPRVVVMDRTNARYLESLPELVDFTSIDASFISLARLFPAVLRISKPESSVVALIKPQFEAGKGEIGKKGVVRDSATHQRVLAGVIREAAAQNLILRGLTASPLKGPAGNIEFLGYFVRGAAAESIDVPTAIREALEEAPR